MGGINHQKWVVYDFHDLSQLPPAPLNRTECPHQHPSLAVMVMVVMSSNCLWLTLHNNRVKYVESTTMLVVTGHQDIQSVQSHAKHVLHVYTSIIYNIR